MAPKILEFFKKKRKPVKPVTWKSFSWSYNKRKHLSFYLWSPNPHRLLRRPWQLFISSIIAYCLMYQRKWMVFLWPTWFVNQVSSVSVIWSSCIIVASHFWRQVGVMSFEIFKNFCSVPKQLIVTFHSFW